MGSGSAAPAAGEKPLSISIQGLQPLLRFLPRDHLRREFSSFFTGRILAGSIKFIQPMLGDGNRFTTAFAKITSQRGCFVFK